MDGEHRWRRSPLLKLLIAGSLLVLVTAEELRECREQEYKDRFGMCATCKQCDAGQELSKECGFGYGEDAQCVACRPGRFKEGPGPHKCKPCLDCALVNRFQKGNCSSTANAVCGDCMPGFYRKTKLSGFQDMECIPCGDPPPPYEPHCSSRVNLVPITSTVTSPRDVALAAVICSALAAVLLALLILCVIYCKRQLLEKKPNVSSSSQVSPYNEAELLCFDRRQGHDATYRTCCQCHHSPSHTCGPVLIPSLCCDEACSLDHSRETSPFHSLVNLSEGHLNHVEENMPLYLGGLSNTMAWGSADSWPLMHSHSCTESLDLSQCALEPKERNSGPLDEEEKGDEAVSTAETTELRPDHNTEDQGCMDSGSSTENISQPKLPQSSSLEG
ncbi:tumor necrosis factor receptor superfamily member 19 [Scleropages formosus]|nr:tumor necrosis factor receptor superfamily member 19 [Scleropages formosus]XP_029111059.1 tumor necrosis factor receptor superfamily member 19 [Scleropages formosus]XP_029111060.1 tumor necrosis factor receptor superfamily member 19 [Scleropages formosus]